MFSKNEKLPRTYFCISIFWGKLSFIFLIRNVMLFMFTNVDAMDGGEGCDR